MSKYSLTKKAVQDLMFQLQTSHSRHPHPTHSNSNSNHSNIFHKKDQAYLPKTSRLKIIVIPWFGYKITDFDQTFPFRRGLIIDDLMFN